MTAQNIQLTYTEAPQPKLEIGHGPLARAIRNFGVVTKLAKQPAALSSLWAGFYRMDSFGEFDAPAGYWADELGYTKRGIQKALACLVEMKVFQHIGVSEQYHSNRFRFNVSQTVGDELQFAAGVNSSSSEGRTPVHPKQITKANKESKAKAEPDSDVNLWEPNLPTDKRAITILVSAGLSRRQAAGFINCTETRCTSKQAIDALRNARYRNWLDRIDPQTIQNIRRRDFIKKEKARINGPIRNVPGFMKTCINSHAFKIDDRVLAFRRFMKNQRVAAIHKAHSEAQREHERDRKEKQVTALAEAEKQYNAMTGEQRKELHIQILSDANDFVKEAYRRRAALLERAAVLALSEDLLQ